MATYKRIKTFDREKMQDFLTGIYEKGAREAGASLDTEQLRVNIGNIKGIGERHLNEIMEVNQHFSEKICITYCKKAENDV